MTLTEYKKLLSISNIVYTAVIVIIIAVSILLIYLIIDEWSERRK